MVYVHLHVTLFIYRVLHYMRVPVTFSESTTEGTYSLNFTLLGESAVFSLKWPVVFLYSLA